MPKSNGSSTSTEGNDLIPVAAPPVSVGGPAAEQPPPLREPPLSGDPAGTTGLVYDERMQWHDGPVNFPERADRLSAIRAHIEKQGLVSQCRILPIAEALDADILTSHSPEYLATIAARSTEMMQSDMYMCPWSELAARLSCGGVLSAARAVATGEVRNALAVTRPPGHHAEPGQAMGFCFFSNVAIAAKDLLAKGLARRVAVVDWDVHHGNGTQRALADTSDVLFISLHRYDNGKFYPMSGAHDDVGRGAQRGRVVNIPWPRRGLGDAEYLDAFSRVVQPVLAAFSPDMILVSAGFDAAEGDPLGRMNVTPEGFAEMTARLAAVCPRLVLALEGGYNRSALAYSLEACLRVLLGEAPPAPDPEANTVPAEDARLLVDTVIAKQKKYWPVLDTAPAAAAETAKTEQ